jgi:hypothetical protein
LPDGVTLDEYAGDLLDAMPSAHMTRRESWAIKQYVQRLQFRLCLWRESYEIAGKMARQANIEADRLRAENERLDAVRALPVKWIGEVPAAGVGMPRDGEALQRCAYELEAALAQEGEKDE